MPFTPQPALDLHGSIAVGRCTMKARWKLLPAIGVAALGLAACGPSYVGMRVGPPPPRPAYGVIGVAPGPGYMWTDGFWDLRGGRWYWVNGRWMRPPRYRSTWVPPHWSN